VTGSAKAGHGKADFNHIYDQPDPRDYFSTLGEFGYEIPQRALPVFQALLTALRSGREAVDAAPLRVLDLCCSYGVNAALMRCDVSMDELFDHYANPAFADLLPAELFRKDEAYYAERCRPDAVRVSGLDVAGNAVAYGCGVGLLDAGWSEDLEASDPSPQLTDHLKGVDLVTTTGGVGYITERIFRPGAGSAARRLGAVGGRLRVADGLLRQNQRDAGAARPRDRAADRGDLPTAPLHLRGRAGCGAATTSAGAGWTRPAWRTPVPTTPTSSSHGRRPTPPGSRWLGCWTASFRSSAAQGPGRPLDVFALGGADRLLNVAVGYCEVCMILPWNCPSRRD